MHGNGTTISIPVPRALTEWEMDDVKQAVDAILNQRSFFYAGSDDIGDEIVKFMADKDILTNLETVIED
jgi:hypothetical protein